MKFSLAVLTMAACAVLVQPRALDKDESTKNNLLVPNDMNQDDMVLIGGKQYYLHSTTYVNGNEAAQRCRDMGMSLVSLETEEEEKLIQDHIDANDLGQNIYWSSGRKQNDSWVWSASDAPFTYTNWATSRPYSLGPELCVFFNRYSGWSDYDCVITSTLFMCE